MNFVNFHNQFKSGETETAPLSILFTFLTLRERIKSDYCFEEKRPILDYISRRNCIIFDIVI